jgi:hypothetical protein
MNTITNEMLVSSLCHPTNIGRLLIRFMGAGTPSDDPVVQDCPHSHHYYAAGLQQ